MASTTANIGLQRTSACGLAADAGSLARRLVLQLLTVALFLGGVAHAADSPKPDQKTTPGRIIFSSSQSGRLSASDGFFALHAPFWTPEAKDTEQAEASVAAFLKKATPSTWQGRDMIDVLKRWPAYQVQYFGFTKNGRRLLFGNAFCDVAADRHPDSRKRLVTVMDGGACYFHFTYDPKTRSVIDFSVNGVA